MTTGPNFSWPGLASAVLTMALALFLFGWNENDAAPRPPPDPPSPEDSSSDALVPIALPPPPEPARDVPVQGPKSAREGRVLLRQLEAGDGPSIEIAWPSSPRDRDDLHAVFIRCYGMVTAILDGQDRLFRASDPPGRNWVPDRERYSGFVRQVSGQRVAAQNRTLAQIRARHRISAGTPVRLFPRAVDATLLGGLYRLTGANYAASAAIRARYDLSGAIVRVTRIAIGSQPMPGSILLRPACRGSSPSP